EIHHLRIHSLVTVLATKPRGVRRQLRAPPHQHHPGPRFQKGLGKDPSEVAGRPGHHGGLAAQRKETGKSRLAWERHRAAPIFARTKSHTSRTAPAPPLRSSLICARSRTDGWASAATMPQPTLVRHSRSLRSFPT